jgi:hypothetical protein
VTAAPEPPTVGTKAVPALLRQIGDYDVTGVLGRGGFGVVYSAVHRTLGDRRAIKVLAAELAGDDEMIKRFSREATIVNLIEHAGIIKTLEVGRISDGRPYFVMEQLDGIGLDQMIRTLGALALADTVAILAQVCDALAAAHATGVVHRDLKASNIIVAPDRPGSWRVWLTDFGIAKLLDVAGASSLTVAGQRLGTPEYMAPEQVLGGDVDARTDVYALGILAFHMLTGAYPFRDHDPREVERMQVSEPAALAGPAPEITAVIQRALEKLPRRRWPSAPAFLAALRSAAAAESETGTATATGTETATGTGTETGTETAEAGPTRQVRERSTGEVAVIAVVDAGGAPDVDAPTLARGTSVAVELRRFDDRTLVCVIRARAGTLADDVATIAIALHRAAPDAAIAVRLATGGATELHLAFNAAIAAVRAPAAALAIAIDETLAARLADRYRIDRVGATAVLVPEPP